MYHVKPTLTVRQSIEMAWRHYQAGTREDARMISLRVLDIEPTNSEALHLLGVLAYEANDQERAIALLRKAAQGNSRSAPIHGNLALAKLAKGDLVGAAASARKAFSISPSYADAHRVLGLVYERKGRLIEALREFERAKRLGLNSEDLRTHLARVQKKLAPSGIAAPETHSKMGRQPDGD